MRTYEYSWLSSAAHLLRRRSWGWYGDSAAAGRACARSIAVMAVCLFSFNRPAPDAWPSSADLQSTEKSNKVHRTASPVIPTSLMSMFMPTTFCWCILCKKEGNSLQALSYFEHLSVLFCNLSVLLVFMRMNGWYIGWLMAEVISTVSSLRS